jgi:putative endonuclease
VTWWVYILECHSGLLYTGIAKDVDARFEAHSNGTGAMFTKLNRPVRILGKAPLATKGAALRAEYALKKLSRIDKLRWCSAGLDAFVLRGAESEGESAFSSARATARAARRSRR